MIAAGTHATEGKDWSPETSGPIPNLRKRNLTSDNPRIVPTMTEAMKPIAARRNEFPTALHKTPWCVRVATECHTLIGLGRR